MKASGFIRLVSFSILVALACYTGSALSDADLPLTDILIMTFFFALISVSTLLVFFRGQKKEPASQTMHSLIAMGSKLIFELILALGWFIIAKKNNHQSVILFFVLYLAFTLYSILIIVKSLKDKSLNNNFDLENN